MKGSLLRYWHHILFQYQRLSDFTVHLPETLDNPEPGPVYVCPYRASTIVPLWIPAILAPDGSLQVPGRPSVPWIPLTFLDSEAPHGIILGEQAIYERCLLEFESTNDWDLFYETSIALFETVTQGSWRAILQEGEHTPIQDQPVIISEMALPHWLNAQAALWERLVTMEPVPEIIATVLKAGSDEAAFRTVLPSESLQALSANHLGHVSQNALDNSQRTVLAHLLELPLSAIQAVHTPPHTGKEALVASYAASHWVSAALKREKPPLIVVMTAHAANWKARASRSNSPHHLLAEPWISENHIDQPLFLDRCSIALGIKISSLHEAKNQLHKALTETCAALSEGLAKYQKEAVDFEALDAELLRLQNEDQELEIQFELLTDGLKYWQSELPTTTGWRQAIEWATQSRKKMRDEITSRFVEKGIIGVTCLGWLEVPFEHIESILRDKISEIRVRRTQLHHSLIPLCEKIAKRSHGEVAWLNWQKSYVGLVDNLLASQSPEAFLDQTVRHQAYAWALHYWEACWLESLETGQEMHSLERQAMRDPYVVVDEPFSLEYYAAAPKIHTWITLDATAISPMEAVAWLYHSERAIALGDRQLSPEKGCVLSSVDASCCYYFELAENEEELEDLYFSGKLVSATSWLHLAAVASYFQSGDFAAVPGTVSLALQHNQVTHPDLIRCAQSNGYTGLLLAEKQGGATTPFGYLCIKGQAQPQQGGFINLLEARQIVLWLQANRTLLKLYPKPSDFRVGAEPQLNEMYERVYDTCAEGEGNSAESLVTGNTRETDLLAIVTPFAAQKKVLQKLCREAGLSFISVLTISELSPESQYGTVLLSPTYTSTSPRPFSFDRGPSFLNRLLLAAENAVFVMGDMEAFDPNMHSPSGKLAKWLFSKEEYHLPHYHLLARGDKVLSSQPIDLPSFYNQLQDTLVSAMERFVIVTPRLSIPVVEELQFLTQIKTAVSRGVEVFLYIGDGYTEGWQDLAVQEVLQRFIEAGTFVRIVHHIQATCCWADDALFLESLHPWLVLWRDQESINGLSVNQYQGDLAKDLIKERQLELNARTIRRFKPKALQSVL